MGLLLYLAFGCSGAAALIYEITWTRLLTLLMGHTVAAASTVLAAFMGGLAIGAAVGGRVSERLDRPAALRAYAVVELAIACFAAAVPFELDLLEPVLAATYADGSGGATFALTRIACALLVVTVPAIPMGATLPLVIRWQAGSAARAGRDTGLIYAANTIGAAAGALLSGFLLLPALGIRGTTAVGIALNVVSAGLAWQLSRSEERGARSEQGARDQGAPTRHRPKPSPSRLRSKQPSPLAPGPSPLTAMVALAVSGCVSLILQVAWTRILALVVGPTTFAFSAMVTTFITGIALGALVGGWASKTRAARWLLAGCLLASGLAAAAAAAWAPDIPPIVANAVAAPDASFATVVRVQSALIAALMLPMTLAFGAAFPLAVAVAVHDENGVPRDVARVYAANTAGAIAGALVGGFVLIPWLGLQGTVRAAAALACLGFAAIGLTHAGRRAVPVSIVLATTAAAGAALILMPPWSREVLSSGAYKYAPYMESSYRDVLLRAGRLLYYREGAAATVSVRETIGSRSLAIDGKVDASNGGDMLTQRLLAHLPLLLHPAPRDVAIIGLGSGVTLGSALRHPIESADTLEISPEVLAASRFFESENHSALADRRTRLVVGDGRSHLAFTRRRYDVIISEPSNPWMAGVAALFTREFFDAAKARLAAGGLMCQWAHAYDISDDDLRSIVATFGAVFPHVSLWLAGEADILLIGSLEPLEPKLNRLRTAWSRPGVASDLGDVGVRSAEVLLTMLAAEGESVKSYANGAAIQTDDRMSLEFSGPRSIYGRSAEDNTAILRQMAAHAPMPAIVRTAWKAPTIFADRGAMHLRAAAFRIAFDDFARALEQHPPDAETADGLLLAAAGARRLEDAERILDRLLTRHPANVHAVTARSRLIAARGDFAAAADMLRPLFARPDPELKAIDQLASIFADAGDAESLRAIVRDLERVAPNSEQALYYAAALHFMTDRLSDAIATAERLRARNGRHARCLNLLGAAYATLGRADAARQAFEASIHADPRDPGAYVNLGTFELQAGRATEAENYFAEALTLDPASEPAQRGLAQAAAALRRQ